MSARQAALACLAALWLAACAQSGTAPAVVLEAGEARPVIADLDMAHEDMIALLFLLQHPGVDVRAVTVAGTGEAHCGPGVRNALGLLALAGAEAVPAACGRETPLAGAHAFPEAWRQAADDLYGLSLPEGGLASDLTAPELIAQTVRAAPQKVSLVAVGPLTNVAEALLSAPDIADNIETIYVMGGAVEAGGNVGNSGAGIDNPDAEWNIYVDPHAANVVLEAGVPVTLVPLDATGDVPITMRFYDALGAQRETPEAGFAYDMLGANLDFVKSGGFQFWDTLTAAVFTDESLAGIDSVRLQVVETEGQDSGAMRPAEKGAAVRAAMSADRARFEALLLHVLNLP